ncbi:MAG: phosphomannomutase/phosphoglucomutase [Armatimonadota bacterium]|nr:phosphomannomutase/phosphoglucomutase [Armatimonadota bacterium]MDR7452005.1 phosphomannomutase/phosphoglucomutase [Armatimonadota bacterium]MDR7467896.1 phosphomannomutase/phosphoglucomutase [Armatimonadota bacterium]MDR7494251.1 phosphomannomutase/phosphoglucomutase [Armatimonadota bacterium]MDR7500032.1 phosphomannomutase/phosphoglucomutase [Armatimonadota bacterium]
MIEPTMFREYDIRGVVGKDLTPGVAEAVARGYAAYLRRQGAAEEPIPVVVGRDNRESSPALRDAVVRGLLASGCRVVDVGTVITPVFYFARVHLGIDGGIMITASHNPPEFNGFKLAHGFGTLYGEEIQQIRLLAEQERGRPPRGGGSAETADVVPAYRAMMREKIRLGPRRLRVALDCGNGTASLIAPDVLRELGCEVLPLYCDSDPRFPHHHPDPVQAENLQDLIALVRSRRADVGIGLDGDGDRIGVVDDQGGIIWGDLLMILFWREILPKHPGTVGIVEVKCSQALYEEIERLGGRPIFYRTGHSLIKAKMREVGAVFTGEMSGHMFFADEYFGYDDAVYAAGRLLRILSHADRPLSRLMADVPRYNSTPEVRVDCPDEAKFGVVETLVQRFRRHHQVIDIDGVRVLFGHGWGLVRASNTQPALVVRAESRTPAGLREIKRSIETELSTFPQVGPIRW